jgi:hypothetical protein
LQQYKNISGDKDVNKYLSSLKVCKRGRRVRENEWRGEDRGGREKKREEVRGRKSLSVTKI